MASRLSKEKRPDLAVGAAAELARRGHRVHLAVAGDGPLRQALQARGGPVEWLGFVRGREQVSALLGGADVVLAPGPVETFGLAALEALACGTPVVANVHSALPEVLGDAGPGVGQHAAVFADAVEALLADDRDGLRAAARRRAERFPWSATVEGFLTAHGLRTGGELAAAA
jgi:alpha-1,6-mannosyltransferase